MDTSVPEQRSSTQEETQLYGVILFALGALSSGWQILFN